MLAWGGFIFLVGAYIALLKSMKWFIMLNVASTLFFLGYAIELNSLPFILTEVFVLVLLFLKWRQ